MFVRAHSGTVIGVDAHPVVVEAHKANGLPGMTLIGLARGAVKESIVRVRSAVIASGLKVGHHRVVINLLPAELPKEASSLDLPLAIALLSAIGMIPPQALPGRRFFGELSLGGALEPVRGAVVMADLARRYDEREVIVPLQNAQEAAIIPGVRVLGARNLSEVLSHLRGDVPLLPTVHKIIPKKTKEPCLSEVRGQERAKRALEIAAAGRHNLLMIGAPGSGKTMLARRLPGIMPSLSTEESIEVTRIHSAAGVLRGQALAHERPFRAPHHTASDAALCGGGSLPRPGELTLAHRGVLFLDELPEFSRRALESLREPLEEGSIHVARTALSLTFPAEILLVAAMNPCPCGYFQGDGRTSQSLPPQAKPCLCHFEQIQRYRTRLSGPLLDRIDLHVLVDPIPLRHYAARANGEPSHVVRERVVQAREKQQTRLGEDRSNASMQQVELQEHVVLTAEITDLLENAVEQHGLSTRAVGRILKVARTIADLEDAKDVETHHVAEAVGFRVLDRSEIY